MIKREIFKYNLCMMIKKISYKLLRATIIEVRGSKEFLNPRMLKMRGFLYRPREWSLCQDWWLLSQEVAVMPRGGSWSLLTLGQHVSFGLPNG